MERKKSAVCVTPWEKLGSVRCHGDTGLDRHFLLLEAPSALNPPGFLALHAKHHHPPSRCFCPCHRRFCELGNSSHPIPRSFGCGRTPAKALEGGVDRSKGNPRKKGVLEPRACGLTVCPCGFLLVLGFYQRCSYTGDKAGPFPGGAAPASPW